MQVLHAVTNWKQYVLNKNRQVFAYGMQANPPASHLGAARTFSFSIYPLESWKNYSVQGLFIHFIKFNQWWTITLATQGENLQKMEHGMQTNRKQNYKFYLPYNIWCQ